MKFLSNYDKITQFTSTIYFDFIGYECKCLFSTLIASDNIISLVIICFCTLDSPLAKPPQIENVSPPVIAKLQHSVSQATQPTPVPTSSVAVTTPAQGQYYQQGYKFKGMPGKDPSTMVQEIGTQQMPMGQQILNTSQMVQNSQTMGNVYSHGIPVHNQNIQPVHGMVPTQSVPPHGQVIAPARGQVIGAHDSISMGLDQGQYAYGMGQPQQPQQQQQQHLHSYTPSQMPPAAQWQAQQQGLGPGWMK